MKFETSLDQLISDACAHAELELRRKVEDRQQNRKNEIWHDELTDLLVTAVPVAFGIALRHVLSAVLPIEDQ